MVLWESPHTSILAITNFSWFGTWVTSHRPLGILFCTQLFPWETSVHAKAHILEGPFKMSLDGKYSVSSLDGLFSSLTLETSSGGAVRTPVSASARHLLPGLLCSLFFSSLGARDHWAVSGVASWCLRF